MFDSAPVDFNLKAVNTSATALCADDKQTKKNIIFSKIAEDGRPLIINGLYLCLFIDTEIGEGMQNFGHEQSVKHAIQDAGFTKRTEPLTAEQRKELKDAYLNKSHVDWLEIGQYIDQPFGPQDNPDFLIRDETGMYGIEAKSAQGKTPTYNGGLPKENCFYVFTTAHKSVKGWATEVYNGYQVADDDLHGAQAEIKAMCDQMIAEYNKKNPDACITLYPRIQAQHKGKPPYFQNNNLTKDCFLSFGSLNGNVDINYIVA